MPAYAPGPGFVLNPLRKFPRNLPCPCGSQKKFKKCHEPIIARTCSIEIAKKLQPIVDMALNGEDVALALENAEKRG